MKKLPTASQQGLAYIADDDIVTVMGDTMEREYEYSDFIDDEIALPEGVPDFLMELIEQCEALAREGNDYYYDLADFLDTTCKNAFVAKEITKDLWKTLQQRYLGPQLRGVYKDLHTIKEEL